MAKPIGKRDTLIGRSGYGRAAIAMSLVVAPDVPGIDFETSYPLSVYAQGGKEAVPCPA